jgi:hypothetical protein
MPATLSQIKGKVSTLAICLSPDKPENERTPDDYFTIKYQHGGYTAKIEQVARSYNDQQMPITSLVEYVLGLVVSWDLKPGPDREVYEALENLKFQMEAAALREDRDRFQFQYQQLKSEVDAQTAAQEPLPLTRETLENFPAEVLGLIVKQVSEAIVPNIKGTDEQ